jgi:hypothetical protein
VDSSEFGSSSRGVAVAGAEVSVAEAIERLREELESALAAGRGRAVQFGVGEVTLTLNVVAERSRDASAKIRWWLVEAGGGVGSSSQVTQTLVLTLRPQLVDEHGARAELLVGAEDVEDEGPPAADDPPTGG